MEGWKMLPHLLFLFVLIVSLASPAFAETAADDYTACAPAPGFAGAPYRIANGHFDVETSNPGIVAFRRVEGRDVLEVKSSFKGSSRTKAPVDRYYLNLEGGRANDLDFEPAVFPAASDRYLYTTKFSFNGRKCFVSRQQVKNLRRPLERPLVTYDRELCAQLAPEFEKLGTENSRQCSSAMAAMQMRVKERIKKLDAEGVDLAEGIFVPGVAAKKAAGSSAGIFAIMASCRTTETTYDKGERFSVVNDPVREVHSDAPATRKAGSGR